MLKTISAIFCTVWIYHFCIAQYSINQVFYNEVTTKNFSIKYNPAETNHPTNVIFNRIKNHYNKPINLLEWSIQIKLQRKLTLRPAQQFEIYVAQTEYTFSGDNIYRGFNIENKVKPAIQSIKIQLKHKTARTASPYYEKVFYANDFHPPILVQENYAYTKDSISLSDYELNIVEVVLNNSPEQTTAFLSFADKIDQYYTDSQTLPALLYQTMSVQSTNIDLLPMEEQKLIAVEQKINAIIAQRYMEELELNKQDPANFSAQMNQVMTLAAQKRNEINQTKANAHIIFYQRGMALLQQNQRGMAKKMFENSLAANPQFAPAMLPLAQLELQENNPEKAAQLARTAKQFSMGEPGIIKDAQAILSDVVNFYLSRADKAMQAKNPSLALDAVQAAKIICQNEQLNCEPVISNKVKSIKTTVLDNMIREAMLQNDLESQRKGLENALQYAQNNPEVDNSSVDKARFELKNTINKIFDKKMRESTNPQLPLDLQRSKIEEALQYAKYNPEIEHNSVINAQNQLKNVVQQIFNQKITQIDAFTQTNNFTQAENTYADAVKFQQQYSTYITDLSTLQTKYQQLKQKQYIVYVQEAQTFIQQKNGVSALDKLKQALSIQQQYPVSVNNQIPVLQQQAAKIAIQNKYDYGLLMVKQNNLNEAKMTLNTMHSIRAEYNLQQDATTNQQINELQGKLFSQICINAQNEVDALTNSGKIQEQSKNFLQADVEYQKAIEKTKQNPECNLNISTAQERKAKIQPAVMYQSSMNEIEKLYQNARFTELISKYISITSQWQADNLKITFDINHLTLLEYTKQKNNPTLMITVANTLLDQNNPDFINSMQLLKMALNNQIDVRSTENLQQRLGVFYAKNDHQNNNSVNGKTQVIQHTGNDKRLKVFTKSYLNTLKSLQRK
ncbi:MAG: hypothetical protein RML94_00875 [Bacteroidia bacterium]|nr:hypothetical protein [Bacteroidia bacterium]